MIIKSLKKTDPNGLKLDNISDLLYSSIIDQKIKSTDILDKNQSLVMKNIYSISLIFLIFINSKHFPINATMVK